MEKPSVVIFLVLSLRQYALSLPTEGFVALENLTNESICISCPSNETLPVFENEIEKISFNTQMSGTSIILDCSASGNPTPKREWLFNGKPMFNSISFIESNDLSVIMLSSINKNSEGNYTCVVCNIKGCITFTKILTVYDFVFTEPTPTFLEYTFDKRNPFDDSNFVNNFIEENKNWEKDMNAQLKKEHDKMVLKKSKQAFIYANHKLVIMDKLVNYKHTFIIIALGSVLCMMFFISLIMIIYKIKKFKREKLKKQLAKESTKVICTHWTKKIIVEKIKLENKNHDNTDLEEPLFPTVKIEKQKKTKVNGANIKNPKGMSEYELPLDNDWEFPREMLTLGKVLGAGEFGEVVIGEGDGILKQGYVSTVAVKMLKESHSDIEMMALVSEMEMMKLVGRHVNIINFLGCCTQGGPLYVIVEYARHGNLREFLRSHRNVNKYDPTVSTQNSLLEKKTLTRKDLVSFSCQVARGMEYLASRKCIHRDLAARNVLVSDKFVLKIADFGLAKDIHSKEYYRKKTEGQLPVRWMAPESFYHKIFTTQTDVWSFGVLLWEIMTFGSTPYSTVLGQFLLQYLSAGNRLEKPPFCSQEIYMLMKGCWAYRPSDRLSFGELVEKLEGILKITANHDNSNHDSPQSDLVPTSYNDSADDEFK